ncbi:MAG: hypothetical protein ACYSW7_04595 [Planctomycetota bacterium]|jgi:hypothetical protein
MVSIKIYRKYLTTAALIWAACFMLFFFVYMLVLRPQKGSKKQVENKLTEKKQMYESALKATQEETRIQLNEQIERLRNRLGDFVIDFEDSANLTFDISQIAGEEKLASFSVKSRDSSKVLAIPNCDYICENHIDVSFGAWFPQFATFLNALERHRPVLFVDKFAVSSGRGGSSPRVNVNLVVLTRKRQDS